MRGRVQIAVFLGLLLVVATAVFAPALGHGFVVFDDYSKVTENPVVTHYFSADLPATDRLLTPGQGYVIPVTVAAWATLHALGGGQAWVFHLASLLLHLLFVVQLFFFLRRWSWRWGVAAALVFAVHPLVVEPVVWVTGLKDLLAANFALAGTVLFVRGVEKGGRAGRSRLAGAALCALLAALSKPTTVLIGGAWLLWLGSRRAAAAAEGSPVTAGRAPYSTALMTLASGLLVGVLSFVGHQHFVQSPEPLAFGSGRALLALGLQARHLVSPVGLHPLYYAAPGAAWGNPYTYAGLGVLLALAAVAWRGRHRPRVVLGLGVMVMTYLPVSNLVPVPRLLADSYLYLPLAGVLLVLETWRPRRESAAIPPRSRVWLAAGSVLVVLILGAASFVQVRHWRSEEAFWYPLIERWPHWDRGYYGLATARLRQRRDGEAAKLYRAAYARGYRAEHLADFGVALAASGQPDDAECVLVEAIHQGNRRAESLRNYGRLLASTPRRALRYPRQAARLVPRALAAIARHHDRHRAALRLRLGVLRRRLGPPGATRPWPRGRCPLVRSGRK